ncbi:hypothetical protein Vafri_1342 [Volvox africanus]|nr:hypothetical protein Vafri_1342 [Volvox africanus]
MLFAAGAGAGTAGGTPDAASIVGASNALAGGGNSSCLSAPVRGMIPISTPQQQQQQQQSMQLGPGWQQQLQQQQEQQRQQQEQQQQLQQQQQQQQLLLQLQLQQQQQQLHQLQQWQTQQQLVQGLAVLQQQQQQQQQLLLLGAQPTSLLASHQQQQPDLDLPEPYWVDATTSPAATAAECGGPGEAPMATTVQQQADQDVSGAQAMVGTAGIPYSTYGCGLPTLGLLSAPAPPAAGLMPCGPGGVGLGPFGPGLGLLLVGGGGEESGAGGQPAALIPYGSAGGADPTAAMQQLYAAQQLLQLLKWHRRSTCYSSNCSSSCMGREVLVVAP